MWKRLHGQWTFWHLVLIMIIRQIAPVTYLYDVWLINLSLVSFSNFIWKALFSRNTHFIHFLLEYKDGYCAHYKDFIIYSALDKNSVNLEKFWEFGISFKEYILPNGWVRMFSINLKISLVAILWPSHWLCWCHRSLVLRNENPGTLASCNCTKDPLPI